MRKRHVLKVQHQIPHRDEQLLHRGICNLVLVIKLLDNQLAVQKARYPYLPRLYLSDKRLDLLQPKDERLVLRVVVGCLADALTVRLAQRLDVHTDRRRTGIAP